MVKGKGSVVIKLVSMAGSGFFYLTRKNPKKATKLLLRKFDPYVNQHVLFKEEKVSRRKIKQK